MVADVLVPERRRLRPAGRRGAARPRPGPARGGGRRAAGGLRGLPRLRPARHARSTSVARTRLEGAGDTRRGGPPRPEGRDRAAGRARHRPTTDSEAARRLRRPAAADLGPGDGQGHRGHRVLPLAPPGRPQRGRRRPRPARRAPRAELLHRWAVHQQQHWPLGHDHAVHPRHQAQRGRPGPAGRRRRRRRVLAALRRGVRRRGPASAASTCRPRTSSGRPSPASATIAEERLKGYLVKAMRESKQRTSWLDSDPEYEARVLDAGRRRATGPAGSRRWSAPPSTTTRRRSGRWCSGRSCSSSPCPASPTPTRAASSWTCRWSTRTTAARSTTTTVARGSRTCATARPATSTTRSCWSPTRRSRCAASCATRSPTPATTSRWSARRGTSSGSSAAARSPCWPPGPAKRLEVVGGWDGATFALPEGLWRDELTGALHGGAENSCADVLADYPVALLRRVHMRVTPADLGAAGAGASTWSSATPGTRCGRGGDGWWRGDVDGRRRGPLRLLPRRRRPPPRPAGRPAPRRSARPERASSTSRRTPGPTVTGAASSWPGAVIYETHVGTFTPEGTLDAAAERLPYLVDLGVDVVELLPLATFPGRHNWGYDGVAPYSVHEAYGGPGGAAAVRRRRARARPRGLPRRGLQPPRPRRELPRRDRAVLQRRLPDPVGPGAQPRRPRQPRGAPLGARQRAAVAARLPRRRAAARRRARAARRHRRARCSRRCPARSTRSPPGPAARCGWSRSPTATTPAPSPRAAPATRSAGSGCTPSGPTTSTTRCTWR